MGNEDSNNNAPVLFPFKQPFAKNVQRTPLAEFVICFWNFPAFTVIFASVLKNYIQDAYQERLRDMARWRLDNLPALLILFGEARKGANSIRRGGIDKSVLKLKNGLQNIKAHLIYRVSFLFYNSQD